MIKRAFDFFASLVGLVVFMPIFLSVCIIIALSSKGPVLFKQARVGKDAKLFTMVKFRTMILEQSNHSTVSVKGDSRITKEGAFLRKYKLDELPGLWNVLIGEMSFVGPRPDVPGYADILEGEDRKVLNLRPGITGPASLKFANEEEILAKQDDPEKYNSEVIYPEKVKINLDYYHNRDLLLDIKIIFATVFRTNY